MTDEARDHRRGLVLAGAVLAVTVAIGWPVLRIVSSGGLLDRIELARVPLPGLDISLPRWQPGPTPHDWNRGSLRLDDAALGGHAELRWEVSDQTPAVAAVRAVREAAGRDPERTWQFELEGAPGAGAVASAGGAALGVTSFRCPSDPRLFTLSIRIAGATQRDQRELSAKILNTAICVQDVRQQE